jgi:hypothetical protein
MEIMATMELSDLRGDMEIMGTMELSDLGGRATWNSWRPRISGRGENH